ncbi:sorbosone dehydrogenase family protein [Chitinophaga sp. CF418]|uniref:PQQ-dependent sugar dehydrogenase n=1 Tax=Chitinophaga sp. CF418 TaxID=1855287 RepID=UPI001CB8505A|nr:PQQ-dependent sugar dehydrogenase [Chitinophaga sp. CF418]
MQKTKVCLIVAMAMTAITTSVFAGGPGKPGATDVKPDANNAGLKLPAGFGALKVADSLGRTRHIAVTSNGGIYIKLDRAKNNNGILYLQDANGDGKIDKKTGFGAYGGTGIYVKGDYLYATSNEDIYRYKLDAQQQVIDPEHPETVVSGLINRRQHESKSIVLDDNGNIYVNIGAYSNSCQTKDRTAGSMGMQPCPILDSAAGIWQFRADKQNQTYGDGVRYATGLRNVVGLDWNKSLNQLFVMQHGRDQLHDLFPGLYTEKQSADLPAECMYALKKGADCGWPYIYYDPFQHKKMLAPEYGGDGKKTGGDNVEEPVVAFPAHMAPNGLLFYTGNQFPERYRNGAFIAFHGSWNRSPENQAGFYVVFVPFKDGKPSGKWEVFADGFAGPGPVKSPGDALHRPCGLAQGPDGSLYVTDDVKGTVYRIVYKTK